MKKNIAYMGLCLAFLSTLNSMSAAFIPSAALEDKIDMVSDQLIDIADDKLGGNYEILIKTIMKYQTKVAGDERKEWVFNALLDNLRAEAGMMDEEVDLNDILMDDSSMKPSVLQTSGQDLEHVSVGQTIREISFDGSETGRAVHEIKDGVSHIYAEFTNLPDAGPDNFYEGWIVRKSPFSFFSTGPLERVNGVDVNTWTHNENISDHDFYVLTLEPNDDDPAPAEHVIEGIVNIIE